MFWIPRINVQDIFGEVIISELTGKRMARRLCELPKIKKISTELQNCHNAEVLEADENVSGTENPTRGKDIEEMEKEDKQEWLHKDGQRVQSEEVLGEKNWQERAIKELGRKVTQENKEQTRKKLEQNKTIGKEIVEQKKGQSGRLCFQVFAKVDCMNSNSHQTQVTNCGNNLTPRSDCRATGPVPQKQQVPDRYYCHQCPEFFSGKGIE